MCCGRMMDVYIKFLLQEHPLNVFLIIKKLIGNEKEIYLFDTFCM